MTTLSPTERGIVSALMAHISRNEEVSLTELAQECHVAKSTVVKALQRIGFQGYREFSYSYRISRDMQYGNLLPREVVRGDAEQVAADLANMLCWCQGKKSLVFLGGRRMGALLANYVSRKLAMFDIFAPASYDYAMVDETQLDFGAAFFFFHHNPTKGFGTSGTGDSMIQTVREHGYRTVVFTDSDDVHAYGGVDVLIRIVGNANPNVDLFATRTIMVFEEALHLFAKNRKEDMHDGE